MTEKETVEENKILNEKTVEVEGRKIKLVRPNVRLNGEADMEYSKAYYATMKDGIPPRIALEQQIRESGPWLDELDEKIQDRIGKLQEIVVKSKAEKDKEKKDKLKEEFLDLEAELTILDSRRKQLLAHCAEAKGDEARLACLGWQCVLNEDGSRVWETKDHLLNAEVSDFLTISLRELVLFMNNVENGINEIASIFDDVTTEETSEETQEENTPEEAKSPEKEEKAEVSS